VPWAASWALGAGNGTYVYEMELGYTSIPHRHRGIEEFLILSGDLTHHDGAVYREGYLVSLKAGTKHCSHTEYGCVITVYSESLESTI
jgi:anti-sigma factor ChrR (cupin superfamily)